MREAESCVSEAIKPSVGDKIFNQSINLNILLFEHWILLTLEGGQNQTEACRTLFFLLLP